MMTSEQAYDEACRRWGDGVAWDVGDGRYIVGRWVPTFDVDTMDRILRGDTKAVEAMGEGASWELAFANCFPGVL